MNLCGCHVVLNIILSCCLLILCVLRQRRKEKKGKNVDSEFGGYFRREELGQYRYLVQELRLHDNFSLGVLPAVEYDKLVLIMKRKICHKDIHISFLLP